MLICVNILSAVLALSQGTEVQTSTPIRPGPGWVLFTGNIQIPDSGGRSFYLQVERDGTPVYTTLSNVGGNRIGQIAPALVPLHYVENLSDNGVHEWKVRIYGVGGTMGGSATQRSITCEK